MAKKVQAKGKKSGPATAGAHTNCGGDLIWSRISPFGGHAKMGKLCDKCGTIVPRAN